MPDHPRGPSGTQGPEPMDDEEWDIWSFLLRVADAEQYMEAALAIDDRLVAHPTPDCCESGVVAPEVYEVVIEQPQPEARRQVEALIAHLGMRAEIAEVRRGV